MTDTTPQKLYRYPDLAVLKRRWRLAVDDFKSVWQCMGYQNNRDRGDGFVFINTKDRTDWRTVSPADEGYPQPKQEELL